MSSIHELAKWEQNEKIVYYLAQRKLLVNVMQIKILWLNVNEITPFLIHFGFFGRGNLILEADGHNGHAQAQKLRAQIYINSNTKQTLEFTKQL